MTKLFLAIPGTQETRELDLETVRNGVARGEIQLDNWAWSPERNEWLPLAQLPEFAVVPAAAPVNAAPVRAVVPKVEPVRVMTSAAPVVKAKAKVTPARVMPAQANVKAAATYYSKPIEEHNEFPIFKVVFFVLGVAIAALTLVNYFFVDQPFRTGLAKTPFSGVTAHAHLGAFVQPNVLLIHVFPSNQVSPDNFADMLAALAQSSPHEGIPGRKFETISLSSAWFGKYAISAQDWNGFADLGGYSAEEKKQFVLSHLQRINGEPLVPEVKNDTAAQRQDRQDEAWKELVADFQSS